jgi:hypothetical protein
MHTLILQGTQTGGVDPRALHLDFHDNTIRLESYDARLDYVAGRQLTLDLFTNTQTFYDVVLLDVIVTNLSTTFFTNAEVPYDVILALVPFVPDNAETTALIAAFDQSYTTTSKRQIDTLISGLKTAGVWAGLDWYGNAYWALSEHDALLNWVTPSETLVKVGSASWTLGAGLSGVNPMITSGRYKSGSTAGVGPHSTSTSFAMFTKITAIAVPQNGMEPMGNWALSSGGPSAPEGSFINISVTANTGSAGANVLPFNGNTGYTVGDGLGVWGTSRNGGTNITVKDGVTLDTDSVSGVSTYHQAEGICVAGTPPGLGAQKSFPGTELYWGWGSAMTAVQFGALETAFQTSLLPPFVDTGPTGAFYIVDDATGDWWVVNAGTSDYYLSE